VIKSLLFSLFLKFIPKHSKTIILNETIFVVSMSFIFDNPQQPCDIIYGEKDTYTDPREIPSQAKLRVKIVKDGDHFFYGSYGDLSAQIMSSLTEEY